MTRVPVARPSWCAYRSAAYVTDTDGNRVRKFVNGATYDNVSEKLGKLQNQEREGIPVPSRSWTVGEWLTYWLEHIVRPNREFNTYTKYESEDRRYLVPHLGKKSMLRLTPTQVRVCMAALKCQELPASARFEVLRTLRNVVNRAVNEELLTRNVGLLADMPKVTKQDKKPWTAREAIDFIRTARSHRLYAACALVLVLGLCRSEVLGLRRRNVDFESGQFDRAAWLLPDVHGSGEAGWCATGHSSAGPAHLWHAARLVEGASEGRSGDSSAQQISMTMGISTHVVDEDQREAAGLLAELLEDPLIG